MSVTKDGDTGRWMSQIRVTDWTGKTIKTPAREIFPIQQLVNLSYLLTIPALFLCS